MLNKKIKGSLICGNDIYNPKTLQQRVDFIRNIMNDCIEESKNLVLAIALPREKDLIATIFACLESHIPYLLLDLSLPKARLQYMIDNANITTVITSSATTLDIDVVQKICIDEIDADKCTMKQTSSKFVHDMAYILYTSGSTGKPKAVEVTRVGLLNLINSVPKIIDFHLANNIVSFTSCSFDIFFVETILALWEGVNVVLADDYACKNAKSMLRLLKDNKADMYQSTPSRLKMLIAVDKDLKCLKQLSVIILGGEKFPNSLLKLLQEKTDAKIYNGYGPTETTIYSTISDLTNSSYTDIGVALGNTKIHLMDQNLHTVPEGEIGEICIGGDGLALGYLNNKEQTEKAFKQYQGIRIYCTGDLGQYDKNGKLLYCGRKDSQVKILGHRIELDEIDAVVENIADILLSVTCYDENNDLLISFYKSKNNVQEIEIKKYLERFLPDYMIPSKYIKTEKFIYTSSGKINKKEQLQDYYTNNVVKRDHSNDSDDTIENGVLTLVDEIIKCKDTSINKSTELGSLGINSLMYASLIVKLEEKFNMEFGIDKFLLDSFNSVGNIVEYIKSEKNRLVGVK